MYSVIGKLASANAPLVFNGGLITKLETPVETLNNDLSDLRLEYLIVPFCKFGEKRSRAK